MAGPTVGTVAYLTGASDTTGQVPVPSGVAADSVVVVFLYRGADGPQAYESLTLPSGFALATNNPGATTGTFHGFYEDVAWKRATGADSGTYDFSWATSRFRVGIAVRLDDCITTGTPYEADAGATSSSASTTTPAVSVTTLGADRLLLWAGGSWTVGTWTPPSGFTDQANADFDLLHVASKAQAAAGSSGSLVGTQSSEAHAAWVGAFIPPTGDVTATAAATLGPLAAAAPVELVHDADADAPLGELTSAAVGTTTLSATATAALGAFTASAAAGVAHDSVAAADLGALDVAATGLTDIAAAATANLGELVGAATGIRELLGIAGADLGPLVATAIAVALPPFIDVGPLRAGPPTASVGIRAGVPVSD